MDAHEQNNGRVLEGDEWKHVREANPSGARFEAQHESNMRYAFRLITREEWCREFDRLSEPHDGGL